jgi:hypothetical protein
MHFSHWWKFRKESHFDLVTTDKEQNIINCRQDTKLFDSDTYDLIAFNTERKSHDYLVGRKFPQKPE